MINISRIKKLRVSNYILTALLTLSIAANIMFYWFVLPSLLVIDPASVTLSQEVLEVIYNEGQEVIVGFNSVIIK